MRNLKHRGLGTKTKVQGHNGGTSGKLIALAKFTSRYLEPCIFLLMLTIEESSGIQWTLQKIPIKYM